MMKRNELNTIRWDGYGLHTTVSIYILRDETKLERGKIKYLHFHFMHAFLLPTSVDDDDKE